MKSIKDNNPDQKTGISPKVTILIVDDDSDTLDLMNHMLLGTNLTTIFARDGYEALAQARLHNPDLVLLDVMMPGIDGFEVCKRLRADAHLADVPILILTVLNTHEAFIQGIKAGADDFITKPYNVIELRARIETILRLNRYRRLTNQRARFEWVVENTDDGYLLVNADDKILYANPQARLYLGLPQNTKDPIKESFLVLAKRLYRCEPSDEWFNWSEQTAATAKQPRFLYRPESSKTPSTWLEVTMHDKSTNGDNQWLIRIRDVTERIASQRDIWTFHKTITHKLRTPLINMTHGMDMLSRYYDKLNPEEIKNAAENALESVHYLQNEINDIVQYLQAPKLTREGDLLVLGEVPALSTKLSEDIGIQAVGVKIPKDLENIQVTLTKQAMEWILIELLENARKFHPKQSPRVAIVIDKPSKKDARLRIIDDGVNVPTEQLPLVWLPYYQSEKQFTGQVAGMGLGLPMVASLIWEAGGSCNIYNRKTEPGMAIEILLKIKTNKNS